ncbi:MAG: hypothetical protein JWL80_624 [Parcubacteria group bacterium]|nr:hypothetical protein [Parcubacteria group bacterium]
MNDNLKKTILEKINAKEISMRPKYYFTFKVAATVLIAAAVLVVSVFIFNFIFFTLRLNDHNELLGFGPRGFKTFFHFFPWGLLLIDIGLGMLLQSLLRHFKFGYRIPYLYLLGGLLLSSFLIGLGVDRITGLNEHFLNQSDKHELSGPLGRFYDHARQPPSRGEGVCTCMIIAIDKNILTVKDLHNASTVLKIVLPMNDPHATTTTLTVGDTVLIAGDEQEGVIEAFGVRKISPR